MLLVIFSIIILLIILFLLNFYKDPERTTPKGSSIVAPADGRIISIINASKDDIEIKKRMLGKIKTLASDVAKECYVISIFMSPIDAHINRAPIEGIVRSVKHKSGTFFRAYDIEKSMENEKNEIVIQNKILKVKVIQIAGFLARRIKCYVKINQKVNKGQKIGMIALSSQTTLVLPGWVDLKVSINQKVKAGETIIATLK